MKLSDKIIVYVNAEQLTKLLKDPLFVAYAPNFGKISGGAYVRSGVFFQLRRSVKA